MLSLSATARRRAARRATGRGSRSMSAARASASSRADRVERVQGGVGRFDARRAPRGTPRPRSARPTGRRRGCPTSRRLRSSDDPGHLEEAAAGRAAPVAVALRRVGEHVVGAERRPTSSGRSTRAGWRRWPSAGRRSCRPAAPRRRARGCRRAGARTDRLRRARARDARAPRRLRPALSSRIRAWQMLAWRTKVLGLRLGSVLRLGLARG